MCLLDLDSRHFSWGRFLAKVLHCIMSLNFLLQSPCIQIKLWISSVYLWLLFVFEFGSFFGLTLCHFSFLFTSFYLSLLTLDIFHCLNVTYLYLPWLMWLLTARSKEDDGDAEWGKLFQNCNFSQREKQRNARLWTLTPTWGWREGAFFHFCIGSL